MNIRDAILYQLSIPKAEPEIQKYISDEWIFLHILETKIFIFQCMNIDKKAYWTYRTINRGQQFVVKRLQRITTALDFFLCNLM